MDSGREVVVGWEVKNQVQLVSYYEWLDFVWDWGNVSEVWGRIQEHGLGGI